MSWFERLAIHDLQADEIRAFFAKRKDEGEDAGNSAAKQSKEEGGDVTNVVSEEKNMEMDGDEDEVKNFN